jgi:ribosomal protein L11 methyltransferase
MKIAPPENLVIFEVEGILPESDRPDFGKAFLGYWTEGDYTFFFFEEEPDEKADRFLKERPWLRLRHTHRMKYSDWQDGADFSPISIGPLVISPAWSDFSVTSAEQLHIRLDPGLAFGFGGHPTTLACLEFLVRVYEEEKPARVLDLGAGTGVLSLAAARLGAKEVKAVELNHIAYETARKNVQFNELERVIETVLGSAEQCLDFPAELLCSNLHLPVQEAILEKGGFEGRRWVILSGLFHSQAEKLEEALKRSGYRMFDRIREARWSSLLLKAG